MVSVVFYCHSRFIVSLFWGRRRSHLCMGNFFAIPSTLLNNCCLNALIATSATLR